MHDTQDFEEKESMDFIHSEEGGFDVSKGKPWSTLEMFAG